MASTLDTFFAAWSETTAAGRRKLVAAAAAESFTYADPRSGGVLAGVDAVSGYVGMFSASAPGWSARVEASDTCHGYQRALVVFAGPGPDGEAVAQHGTYFAYLDEAGKLLSLVGFVGTAPRSRE